MSHTPGPWKVVPDKDESTIDTYHIRTMYDKSIAHIDVFCSDTLGNAKLIAAAPDMVYLLGHTLNYLRSAGNSAKGLQKRIAALLEWLEGGDLD